METVLASETSVYYYKTTRRNIPKAAIFKERSKRMSKLWCWKGGFREGD
jgi:hypothetical protein